MASFSVVTNIASVNAQAQLESTNVGLRQALTRVSSGLRINTSADDAAGLAIANKFRSDVAILNQGIRNANDGLSSLQIKDDALNNISNLVDRLATLATQAASGHTTDATRTTLNQEFQDVLTEITRESTVATLGSNQGFSVFVSNNGTNGVISGTVSSGHVDVVDAQQSGRHESGSGPVDRHGDWLGDHRAGRRPGQRRLDRKPSDVRDQLGAVRHRQQPGC